MTFSVPADAYDRFVGRYSYGLTDALVSASGIRAGSSMLDVGAGTGAGMRRLVELVGPAAVTAVDPSEPFVEALRARFPGVPRALPKGDGDCYEPSCTSMISSAMAP